MSTRPYNKGEKSKKTNIILRVTQLEKEEIEARAAQAGLSVSEYIRRRAMQH